MSKIELRKKNTGFDISDINYNFEVLEKVINELVLFRKNPNNEDNVMNNDLDMNSKDIYNVWDISVHHDIFFRGMSLMKLLRFLEELFAQAKDLVDYAESIADRLEKELENILELINNSYINIVGADLALGHGWGYDLGWITDVELTVSNGDDPNLTKKSYIILVAEALEWLKKIGDNLEDIERLAQTLEGVDVDQFLNRINQLLEDALTQLKNELKGDFPSFEEWKASLKGEKGEDGAQGKDGKSAYEIAVEHGFVGTEQEWLESLPKDIIASMDKFTFLAHYEDGSTQAYTVYGKVVNV